MLKETLSDIKGGLVGPGYNGAPKLKEASGQGTACVAHLRWEAFYEGPDLLSQVEAYRARYGVYPQLVPEDPSYGTGDNRRYLKGRGIRFACKPLGRPKQVTKDNQEALKREQAKRRAE